MPATDTPLPAGLVDRCAALVGDSGVLSAPADIAPYIVDFWRLIDGASSLVLRPSSVDEVSAIVALCAEHDVPIVPQGGNTGLVGGGIPDHSGKQVLLSMQRLNSIRHVDPTGDFLVAEAGCTLVAVQEAAKAVDRLFPLSLGAEGTCQIGGNISTNAGGVNVLRYGMTRALVLGAEVVLADGRVWNGLRSLRKDNTGYDLKQLFIGAEGSLGIVTAAVLRLLPPPRERQTLWAAVATPQHALDLFMLVQNEIGELATSFELIHGGGVDLAAAHLPGVRSPVTGSFPWHVLAEFGWGFRDGLAERVEAVLEIAVERELVLDGTLAANEAQRAMMWRIREGQSEAMRAAGYILRHDVSVPVGRIPEFLARGEELFTRALPTAKLLPFGHLGDGNLHYNFILEEGSSYDKQAIERMVYDLVGELGGSISAEHGIGRAKRDELWRRRDALEREMMRAMKQAFDPRNILNPGVIV